MIRIYFLRPTCYMPTPTSKPDWSGPRDPYVADWPAVPRVGDHVSLPIRGDVGLATNTFVVERVVWGVPGVMEVSPTGAHHGVYDPTRCAVTVELRA